MPRVPTYQPDSVALRGVATNQRTGPGAEAFGGEVGRAAQRLGRSMEGVADLADKMAEMNAANEARTASIEAASRVRETLWGEQGVMRRDGRAFIDAAGDTRKSLEALRSEYSTKGSNAFSQRLIDDVIRREVEPALGQIDRSYVKAVVDENRATASARVLNLIDGTPQVFGDDQAWRETELKLQSAVADEADAYGYDPETRKLKERQAYSRAYVFGISSAINNDQPEIAEKRFEQAVAAGRLTGEAAVELKAKIDDAKNTIAAESFGMEIEQTGGLTMDAGVDFKPPLASAPDPSSTYGPRKHPVDGTVKQHTGIDYPVPVGTPVLASAPGKVVEVQNRGGYGLMVRVDHGGGTESWYAHLSAANVKVGDTVKAGQRLAASGNSGKSTGPHLHYEVRHGGVAQDPTRAKRVELTEENLRTIALERSGGDPKLFKKFMAEGSAAINRREAIKREREQAVLDEAWKYAETATAENQVPRALWNALKPQQREAFRGHFKGNLEGSTETDISHYGALLTMLSDRPKDFARYEFETDNKLSTSDKRALIKERTELRAGKTDTPKRSSLEATNRIANLVMPSSLKEPDQNALKGALYRAVATAEAAQGKPLDEKTIMDMASRLSVETAVGGRKVPLYKAGVGAVKPNVVVTGNIPKPIYNQLVADYQRKFGKMPTAAQVADQYVTLKALGRIQ